MATSKRTTDFVSGLQERSSSRDKKPSLSLCYRSAFFQRRIDDSGVITHSPSRVRSAAVEKQSFREDGFYSISDNPLTSRVVKPYPLESQISFRSEDEGVGVGKAYGKLLEIAVRDVVVRDEEGTATGTALQVASVALLFRGKVICRTSQPFNRKLHKFFVRNALDSSNFSMQVQSQGGAASGLLPLPLPERRAKQRRMEIDFSMSDATGRPRSGLVVCTVSLSIVGSDPERPEPSTYLYTPSASDPNDPRNCFSLAQLRRDRHQSARQARYFLLHDPALCLATALPPSRPGERQEARRLQAEKPDTVVAEQMFSLLDISVRSWFQERRPLRPTSRSSAIPKPHHAGRYRQVFTVTILRGVEVPLREESALVQPIVEVEWADMLRCTTTSDGPAPVWQQTLQFEIPTSKPMSYEPCVQLRLFDQHPVWGLQWLGEARVPLESDQGSLQQFERWIGLSSLYSPSVSFGYVQASPGHWHTRIYVLMKLEQVGTLGTREIDTSSVDALCKAIQRCLVVPYRLAEVEGPDDAANLVMLLAPLPVHYGPLTPRQALNLNKVDHYGRSALLAALLAALGLQSYVLLGSSQTRKWASYALTIAENADATLWDAENGEHYDLQDNRCSLISVSRIINHHNRLKNESLLGICVK
ncbi:uncharacterized protein LOC106641577 [Copidosoma floridanum]|uniref:uncharacterized protein LOC106641577 n=1 Tax=Copidosoma floridanum TaxID=29053 RepID=UPI000C6F4DF2|nr:uncharacterized protein LOC106641577 [Copidosoma floridanum]